MFAVFQKAWFRWKSILPLGNTAAMYMCVLIGGTCSNKEMYTWMPGSKISKQNIVQSIHMYCKKTWFITGGTMA